MACHRSLGSQLYRAARFTPDAEAVPTRRPMRRQPRRRSLEAVSSSANSRTPRCCSTPRPRCWPDPADLRTAILNSTVTPRTSTRSASSCTGCSARPATNPPTPPTHSRIYGPLSGVSPRECPERCPCRDSATAGPPSPATSSAEDILPIEQPLREGLPAYSSRSSIKTSRGPRRTTGSPISERWRRHVTARRWT